MDVMDVVKIEKELERLDDVVSKEVDFTMVVLCAKTIILMYKFLLTWSFIGQYTDFLGLELIICRRNGTRNSRIKTRSSGMKWAAQKRRKNGCENGR